MNSLSLKPTRIFLGVPQTDKIQVYKVPQERREDGRTVITQAILTNTTSEEAKLTLTVNTIDIMKDLDVPANGTKVLDLYIVLNEGDTVSLQQNTTNAINVALNGQYI